MKEQNGTSTAAAEYISLSETADDIIKNHVLLASAAALLPYAGLDVAVVTGVQFRMVRKLAEAYEIPFESQEVRAVLSALSFSTIARLFSDGASSLFNPNERTGNWSKGLTRAAVMGFFTGAVGKIYNMHFEQGGTLDMLDLDHFIEYAKELVRSGELNPGTIFSFGSRVWQSL
ncbi:MAG: DUF697 domain-containing protein [Lewinellaceae bacterium]|nr:DUF697 domain-containing protein [Lewinellaceae bacterium]